MIKLLATTSVVSLLVVSNAYALGDIDNTQNNNNSATATASVDPTQNNTNLNTNVVAPNISNRNRQSQGQLQGQLQTQRLNNRSFQLSSLSNDPTTSLDNSNPTNVNVSGDRNHSKVIVPPSIFSAASSSNITCYVVATGGASAIMAGVNIPIFVKDDGCEQVRMADALHRYGYTREAVSYLRGYDPKVNEVFAQSEREYYAANPTVPMQ